MAAGASLTLQNLTLQGGLAAGAGVSAEGGAIYNQGALTLNGVTVQNNIAQGSSGTFGRAGQTQPAAASTPTACSRWKVAPRSRTTRPSVATARTNFAPAGPGGNGFGGGLYVAGGTAT